MWTIVKKQIIKGESLTKGTPAQFNWVEMPEIGYHKKASEARRVYMEMLMPEIKGTPDDFILSHWQPWVRNVGCVKLKKIK